MTDGLWRGVVPPFRMLDPGLRHAEELLSTALADVCSALADEQAASDRLNSALWAAHATPQLAGDHRRTWHIVIAGGDPAAEAIAALALLVVAGGWHRIKTCIRCGRPFIDRTNGASRRGCMDHPARRG